MAVIVEAQAPELVSDWLKYIVLDPLWPWFIWIEYVCCAVVPGLCRYENDIGCSKYVWNGYAVADANVPFAADIRLPFTARDAPILLE